MHQTGVKGLAEGLRPSHPPASSMKYAATIPQHASTRAGIQRKAGWNNPSLTSNNCHLHSLPTPPNSVGRGDETEEEFTRWVFRKHPWLIDNCTARADTRKHEYDVPYQKCRAFWTTLYCHQLQYVWPSMLILKETFDFWTRDKLWRQLPIGLYEDTICSGVIKVQIEQ